MACQSRWARAVWGLLIGAFGGALGALLGHAAVVAIHRFYPDANLWLKGPHGPPFFDLGLSVALFYGGLGLVLQLHDRKMPVNAASISFVATTFVFFGPLMLATRAFGWGEDPNAPPTLAWFYLVLGAYSLANLSAAGTLGYFCAYDHDGRRGGLGAVLGVCLAYVIQMALRWLLPNLGVFPEVIGWLAPPSALYAGALWGGMIYAGILAARK